jgi:hypothetical protein
VAERRAMEELRGGCECCPLRKLLDEIPSS